MLSVICPIFNEEKYIISCIESILLQDYSKENLEVFFVDGMSSDNTRAIVAKYASKYPFIKLLDNPYKIVPYAMNIGIESSKGDIIMRLDAHAEYPKNYFTTLVRKLIELDADNVGAVCKTDVLNKTQKTLAIREVLCNKFGVGNSIFRLGVYKEQEVDTVPFGCWKRKVFEVYGKYNVKLVRNQDIELNKRIVRGGGKIYIIPETYCVYFARETFKGLAKNNYNNGKWNILTIFYTKQFRSLSIRHYIPLIFVLSLLFPLLISLFYFPLIFIAIASLICYILLLGSISLKLTLEKKVNFCYVLLSFIILHLSYGFGSLIGIIKIPFYEK